MNEFTSKHISTVVWSSSEESVKVK